MPARPVRRTAALLALAALSACGGGATDPSGLSLHLTVPDRMTGVWEGPVLAQVLICRLPAQLTASGTGTAVITGATYTLVTGYDSYDRTWTQDDLVRFLGSDHVTAGQTLTGTIPMGGYVSYHGVITVQYAADGVPGTAKAPYDCRAPAAA